MRRKKRSAKKRPQRSKLKIIIVSIVLLLSIPLTLYLMQNEQRITPRAQTAISPTFFCAGNCPTLGAEPSGAGSGVSQSPSQSSGGGQGNVNGEPCAQDDSIEDNSHEKNERKHTNRSGEGSESNLIAKLIDLIKQLIAVLTGNEGNQPRSSIQKNDKPKSDKPKSDKPNKDQPKKNDKPCKPAKPSKEPKPSKSPSTVPSAAPSPSRSPSSTPSSSPSQAVPSAGAGGAAGGAPVAVAPNDNACGGKYKLNNPMGKNFGDPNCDFDKNKLFEQLKQIDAANASKWFNQVIPCESSFNPNAVQNPAVAVDKAGAWGLFQMGRGKNGPLDHGDVVWGQQAANAVGYNAKLGGSFKYWACARK